MNFSPIGVIRSPHRQAAGTPVQVAFAAGATGTVELYPGFSRGLKDLAEFERIWLIYHLDRASAPQLEVVPYLDQESHGIFSTRSPCRPNPIGMSPVRLLGIDGSILRVADLDVLDGTPLLDIKPYVPAFDAFEATRIGWCARIRVDTPKNADNRFTR